MKKTKVMRLMSALFAIVILFTANISVNAATLEHTLSALQIIGHINLDVFDGYESYEVTPKGLVGYNIALNLPNGQVLKLGFDPRNTFENTSNLYYEVASGWQIKLPYLTTYEYYGENGYHYDLFQEKLTNKISIEDYPAAHAFSFDKINSHLILEKSYGEKEYYNANGCLVKSVNTVGETVEYFYNDLLNKINYSDGTYVEIIKNNSSDIIEFVYTDDTASMLLAQFKTTLNSNGVRELQGVYTTNGHDISFEYSQIEDYNVLSSYELNGTYKRLFEYETYKNLFRVTKINTQYVDGTMAYSIYLYDSSGCISLIEKNDATENYDYLIHLNGNLTINVEKSSMGETTIRSTVYNKYGQQIQYSYPESVLTIAYNNSNRIAGINENGRTTNYTYNEKGLPETAECSDGNIYNYSYSNSGEIIERTVTKNGITKNLSTEFNRSMAGGSTTSTAATGIQVVYNINSEVAVLNWHEYYGLPQDSFNCYTFSIGRAGEVAYPGWYSVCIWYDTSVFASLELMKLWTELDQEALGRSIYDTTVNGTHNSHAWKIALRVREWEDFHFMKKSYQSASNTTYWEFKAGIPGPVMRLRSTSYNPSNVRWDAYAKGTDNKWFVHTPNYYTSDIHYMRIQD